MAKRNRYEGRCAECGSIVAPNEGLLQAGDPSAGPRYLILCPEHSPPGLLAPPAPVDASRLPSIHVEERFGR